MPSQPLQFSFDPFQMPGGFIADPFMREMFLQNMYRLNALDKQGPGGFLNQQLSPVKDQLALQAVQSRKGIASQLAGRGMLGSGAFPVALGQVAAGRQQALANIIPQLMQQYFAQKMALLQGAGQVGSRAMVEQPQQSHPFLGALGMLGGSLLGGPFGAFLGGTMFGNPFERDSRNGPVWV